MIAARIRVDDAEGSFTILVYAESLREAERTAKARYPHSIVSMTFPLEPEYFFGRPHADGNADIDAAEERFGITTSAWYGPTLPPTKAFDPAKPRLRDAVFRVV